MPSWCSRGVLSLLHGAAGGKYGKLLTVVATMMTTDEGYLAKLKTITGKASHNTAANNNNNAKKSVGVEEILDVLGD